MHVETIASVCSGRESCSRCRGEQGDELGLIAAQVEGSVEGGVPRRRSPMTRGIVGSSSAPDRPVKQVDFGVAGRHGFRSSSPEGDLRVIDRRCPTRSTLDGIDLNGVGDRSWDRVRTGPAQVPSGPRVRPADQERRRNGRRGNQDQYGHIDHGGDPLRRGRVYTGWPLGRRPARNTPGGGSPNGRPWPRIGSYFSAQPNASICIGTWFLPTTANTRAPGVVAALSFRNIDTFRNSLDRWLMCRNTDCGEVSFGSTNG